MTCALFQREGPRVEAAVEPIWCLGIKVVAASIAAEPSKTAPSYGCSWMAASLSTVALVGSTEKALSLVPVGYAG